jgi:pilus assembly protein CpaB
MSAITANKTGAASRRPLILALVLGAVAAGLVVAVLASNSSGSTTSPLATSATVAVVVARQAIPVGTKITEDMVELKQIPQAAAISDPVSSVKDIVGQVSRFPVNANEQFSQSRLIQAAQAKSLSFVIPPGLRGVAVPVDKTSSPSELISPGDFVDVVVTAKVANIVTTTQSAPAIPSSGNNDFKAAVTLIQNVQVLSIQTNFVNNGVPYDSTVRGAPDAKTDGSYVTLALTPDQAQLLALASQDGKVTLTLRAFGDAKVADVAPIAEPVRIK